MRVLVHRARLSCCSFVVLARLSDWGCVAPTANPGPGGGACPGPPCFRHSWPKIEITTFRLGRKRQICTSEHIVLLLPV
jgi:hypothetical protein